MATVYHGPLSALTLSLALGFAAFSVAWAAPYEDGLAAYKNGEWDKAYALLKPIAEGDSSQTAGAAERLGRLSERGTGTAKDYAAAAKWYGKAAAAGDVAAEARLGRLYRTGVPGVARDPMQAAKWSIRGASQGNAVAQANLGYMAMDGTSGPVDAAAAAGWFKRSAEQGDAGGMMGLATLTESGKGVPKDAVQAYKWYALASVDDGDYAADLFERAKRQKEALAAKMTPAQVAQGNQLVADFKPVAKR